jgi:hypothetical protein
MYPFRHFIGYLKLPSITWLVTYGYAGGYNEINSCKAGADVDRNIQFALIKTHWSLICSHLEGGSRDERNSAITGEPDDDLVRVSAGAGDDSCHRVRRIVLHAGTQQCFARRTIALYHDAVGNGVATVASVYDDPQSR